MKTKGFTLIELLAVIVILAIIALIATPIIIGIVKDAKNQAEIRNVEIYLSAAKQAVARKNMFEEINNSTCEVQENGSLSCNNGEVLVEMNKETAVGGTIIFDGEKVVGVSNLRIGSKYYNLDSNGDLIASDNALYIITKELTNLAATGAGVIESNSTATVTLIAGAGYELPSTITVTGASSTYDNESGIITLTNAIGNVTITAEGKNRICIKQSGTSQTKGAQYACTLNGIARIFYVLGDNETDSKKVDLIMDRNYTDSNVPVTMAWCESGNENTCTPNITRYVPYIQEAFGNDVIVSIPTYNQIYRVNNWEILKSSKWLYGNLSSSFAPYGYWTSTPTSNAPIRAWNVHNSGSIGNFGCVDDSDEHGIRPVITISKTLMD